MTKGRKKQPISCCRPFTISRLRISERNIITVPVILLKQIYPLIVNHYMPHRPSLQSLPLALLTMPHASPSGTSPAIMRSPYGKNRLKTEKAINMSTAADTQAFNMVYLQRYRFTKNSLMQHKFSALVKIYTPKNTWSRFPAVDTTNRDHAYDERNKFIPSSSASK